MTRLSILLGTVAAALASASVSAADNRLLTRQYNPDQVVRVDGRAGVQATISFDEDEHIENVAIGDSNSWQVTPNKRANLLFVKPLAARARTNMTVVTDRRSYYFDLVASPTANALYLLRFTYPGEPKKSANGAAQVAGLTADEQDIITPAAAPVPPAPRNYGWKQKGSTKLLPAQIYDDGKSTFISWAKGRSIPAVLIRNDRGAEGPVNYAVRDDVMVIEGVPPSIVLRLGRDSATLEYGRAAVAPVKTDARPARATRTIATTASADGRQGQ